jgi:rubrerythrin
MKRTIINLATAFVGECQARNRYTFYAKVARQEGFEQISEIFLTTADNEKEHASWLFKLINQLKHTNKVNLKELTAQVAIPVEFGTTCDNLKSAIDGETYEYTKMYPEFADVAEKEGYRDIAIRLRAIAVAEQHHAERYAKLLKEVKAGTVFKKRKKITWVCRECGYVHVGTEPPETCPSCNHSRSFYQVMCEQY